MSYYQRVLLLFFTLIIINKIAPPPPIRDFNNNTYDCNEESGRSALIWQQIINKSAPPPEIRDHPLFAVVVSLICGGSLWAVVVVKFHRVINNTTWYYDQSYTIMTLCKHRLGKPTSPFRLRHNFGLRSFLALVSFCCLMAASVCSAINTFLKWSPCLLSTSAPLWSVIGDYIDVIRTDQLG